MNEYFGLIPPVILDGVLLVAVYAFAPWGDMIGYARPWASAPCCSCVSSAFFFIGRMRSTEVRTERQRINPTFIPIITVRARPEMDISRTLLATGPEDERQSYDVLLVRRDSSTEVVAHYEAT